ncbi:hypothetical protein [Paracoccus laeviglucosivorans]|uniref:Glutamine amidotransferase n=1 Tax=Paracoccus laeviglucosivorans TaxID=1197861 RepID=A0A521CNT1_9RHOB|nr:hypothetical protein [Paracoccus laeviglucosivorans]SMO61048.1 hypothetical protein SAMN06265221_10561 [Paracoccus laeviglucosivorans]
MTGLSFDPMLPWPLIAVAAVLALLIAVWSLWRGLRGWSLRGLAGLALALALAGPALESGIRNKLSDIVILLDDRSASQSLPGRGAQTDAAIDGLTQQLTALPDTEVRRVTVGDDPDGSLIGTALTKALAAEPQTRVAGVIALTDGLAHDLPQLPKTAPAPVHVLLTGQPTDWDRRLVVEEAPAYGLIDKPVTIRVRIEDQGAVPPQVAQTPARLQISLDGEAARSLDLPPGVPLDLPVVPKHAGQNVVSIGFDTPDAPTPELTTRNNAAAIQIQGVRDRLRVLLVSGEPHAGERTWRNLLKSDANIDLVHFTILRPPDKMDAVPVDEMSLIAFPTQELFMERIRDFDLIIFDRYKVRGILMPQYYDNIRRYVEAGGAVLVSAGPEMSTVESLNLSPLGTILPARPTGRVYNQPFLPELTEAGQRHPVTAGLTGAPVEGRDDHWGRWLRMSQVIPSPRAQVVMTGADDQPLLLLDRVGEGRVAMLTSDQVWLWGRGFEGGGPQLELLRRIAHWSMQEPDLEEEALTADVSGESVTITRRTMAEETKPIRITRPDGSEEQVELSQAEPGRFTANWTAPGPGLYRMTDGDITRVMALGPAAPREFEETVATGTKLAALTQATQGGVVNLSDGVPAIRTVREGRQAHGQGVGGDWIGITPRDAASTSGVTHRPILPGWAWLALVAGLALAGWLAEGRGWRRRA